MEEPKPPLCPSDLAAIRVLLDERDLRYQQRFDAQAQAIKDAFQASKEAISKADNATEKRFEGVNEFRQTLSDQASRFVTRAELEAWKDQATDRAAALAARIDRLEGKSLGLNTGWGYIVAAIAVMAGIAGIIVGFLRVSP